MTCMISLTLRFAILELILVFSLNSKNKIECAELRSESVINSNESDLII